jgi:multicomponent Na+:H+ antiporter subunit E
MKYTASLFANLLLVWLLLSGHYTVLITGLGLLSCALVCWLGLRMGLVDAESQPLRLITRLPLYWLWLTREMARSNLRVVTRIIGGPGAISPSLVSVPVSEKTALYQAIYANSITLTPGTVSVRVQADTIDVHALEDTAAEDLEQGEMHRRILQMKRSSERGAG